MAIRFAKTDADILACYPVLAQLRPQLGRAELIERVRLQEREGFALVLLEQRGKVLAAAGIRLLHNLAWG